MASWSKRDTLGLVSVVLEGAGFVLLADDSAQRRLLGGFFVLAGIAPWLFPAVRQGIAAERERDRAEAARDAEKVADEADGT